MKFVEAYKKLGYKLDNHQTDWSAVNADGVCISIWTDLIPKRPPPIYFDSREVWPDQQPGAGKIGHTKRNKHLESAVREFGGLVDVVLLSGKYGEGYEDAEPWDWKRRGGRWKVTWFEPSNGGFRVEVVPKGKEGN